jgi:hypothetical protein
LKTFCSGLLLQYPDYKKGVIVTVFATSNGIRSGLCQGPLGHDLHVTYCSSVLTNPERIYFTLDRELTSIIVGCKQFRPFEWGRKFKIQTDHMSLVWFFKMNEHISHIMRLKLNLQEFDYAIVYKKGKKTITVMD